MNIGTLIVAIAVMTSAIGTGIFSQHANAEGKGPPTVHIGNPHDFQPGPPIPNCNAEPANPQAGGCKVVP